MNSFFQVGIRRQALLCLLIFAMTALLLSACGSGSPIVIEVPKSTVASQSSDGNPDSIKVTVELRPEPLILYLLIGIVALNVVLIGLSIAVFIHLRNVGDRTMLSLRTTQDNFERAISQIARRER